MLGSPTCRITTDGSSVWVNYFRILARCPAAYNVTLHPHRRHHACHNQTSIAANASIFNRQEHRCRHREQAAIAKAAILIAVICTPAY
jgi:hypothetical protein